MSKNMGLLGRLALFSTALIWGSSFFIMKSALDNIGVLWLLAIRFSISALLLGLVAGRQLLKMSRQALKGGVLLGICLAAAYIVQTYGLKYTTPGKNAFLTATYCVLVPFMAWGIYKRRPDGYHIAAALLCITGIGFVSLGQGQSGINIGDVLTLLCGIFYGLQIIVMEQYVESGSSLTLSAVQFAVAGLICWAGALPFEAAPAALSGSDWLSIAYMSVGCTALCFFLEAWGLKYTPSSTAAMIMTLESVFGTLFSMIFYHETLTPRLFVGFALIFLAVVTSETKLSFLKKKPT